MLMSLILWVEVYGGWVVMLVVVLLLLVAGRKRTWEALLLRLVAFLLSLGIATSLLSMMHGHLF
jgi:hypothetical protein